MTKIMNILHTIKQAPDNKRFFVETSCDKLGD